MNGVCADSKMTGISGPSYDSYASMPVPTAAQPPPNRHGSHRDLVSDGGKSADHTGTLYVTLYVTSASYSTF